MEDSLILLGEVLAGITGGAGVCYSSYRYAIKPIIIKLFIFLKKNFTNTEDLQSLLSKVNQINAQVNPNSGSSLCDSVNRIEKSVNRLRHVQRFNMNYRQDPMFETDEYGNCVWVNDAYIALTGLDREECLGQGWVNSICPSSRDFVFNDWKQALLQRRHFYSNYKLKNVDSSSVFNVKCEAAVDTNGHYVGRLTNIQEVEN